MMYVYLLITIISFCCVVVIYSFIKQIEKLKKDIEDTMKYITDMEIRFEKLIKETKENRNGKYNKRNTNERQDNGNIFGCDSRNNAGKYDWQLYRTI